MPVLAANLWFFWGCPKGFYSNMYMYAAVTACTEMLHINIVQLGLIGL